jgi:PAS domain-containing protein
LRRAGGGYLVALATLVIAGAALWVNPAVTEAQAVALFMAAVAVATWYGGRGPGLAVTVLAVPLINYLSQAPLHAFSIAKAEDLWSLIVFVVVALVLGDLNARLRAARAESEAAHAESEAARARSEVARAELEAILDAVDDLVIVHDRDGSIVRLNRRAREWFAHRCGREPGSMDEVAALVRPRAVGGDYPVKLPSPGTGEHPAELLFEHRAPSCADERFHVRAVAIRDASGNEVGTVSVWRDVTELHRAAIAAAQLDGAVKTIRLVQQEVSDALLPAATSGDEPGSTPDTGLLARRVTYSLGRAVLVLNRLAHVKRFRETDRAGRAMLDLDAATRDEEPVER